MRVQAESRTDVTSGRGQFMVAPSSLGRGSNGESKNAIALATLHRGRMVGVEIEVTMKIDEA